jgi:hypothetical protein
MMDAADSSGLPWGRGDLYTLAIGTVIFGIACAFHRKPIKKAGHNAGPLITELMGLSLSLGPLLMILADPMVKVVPFLKLDLLNVVINESRITLWFSAFVACVNAGLSLIKPREG